MQIYATVQLRDDETLTKTVTEIATEIAAAVAEGQTVEACQVTVTSTTSSVPTTQE